MISKKSYTKPKIKIHGKVDKITKGTLSGGAEGVGKRFK